MVAFPGERASFLTWIRRRGECAGSLKQDSRDQPRRSGGGAADMACCQHVMLLLDTAGGTAGQSLARRAALRLLIYLSCRFGLARVRWAFRFFDSLGARSRPSRVSDFRELGARSWEDFEEELEARLGDGALGVHLPGPAPRAAHTHGALMETLLDYQWDRPEITSPAKPVLRSSGRRLLDVESEAREAGAALGGFGNAVFLLAPCPHSQRELLQFVSGCEAQAHGPLPPARQLMEKLLPKRVQEGMIARKITLYWVDTTERSQLRETPDHLGYWAVCELLQQVGGAILPSDTWSQDSVKAGESPPGGETQLSREPGFSSWISTLPTDSTLNCLLYNSPEYEASFPRTEGTLFLPVEGKEIQEAWAVVLEPLAMHQRRFLKPVRIFLKGTATRWSLPMSSTVGSDSWMLRSPEQRPWTQRALFQQLVDRLTAEELHLVATVDPGDGGPPLTGVMSPLSASATVLTVFRTEEAGFQRHVLQAVVAGSPQDAAPLFPGVVDVVVNQAHNLLEDSAAAAPPGPEWVQQELGRTAPWTPAVTESWFPCSNLSGASSSLMESFCLLQAAPSSKEEPSQTDSELTRRLSELYLRKAREESALGREDRRRKWGGPRTPVRQKMTTMCRSLKMLNVARLNVKAQKLHPDASLEAAGEQGAQKTAGGRVAAKLESRGRARSSRAKDFKTEEELQSYLHENYQKAVAAGGAVLHSCAQNTISAVKAFLKARGSRDLETDCRDQVKNTLLKASKTLRQNLGKSLGKEDRVRECQLQVFLRLELCRQCPSVPDRVDAMEPVVDEVTDLLRTVCLTEDSAYLAKFLEEILSLYADCIPEMLGRLCDSLGFVIPQKLADVLPTGFFSDDSATQDSQSPPLSVPLPSSAPRSASGGAESHQLEELRTRSAKKRRKNALRRHKSVAEVSQNRRQIEVPKISKRAAKNENSRPSLQQPSLPPKDTVQEVTKVRRNLFNQEFSPSKRPAKHGLPRSHSVSAVEGLARELDHTERATGHRRLLTRTVAETPEHKQVSRRLLHRQVKGRSSDPGPDVGVVEESPEREIGLRRSPRIKQLSLSRTRSGPFYSVSPPKSRSVQRTHAPQQNKPDQREHSTTPSVRSPKKLLFGAVSPMLSPSEKGSARTQRPSGKKLAAELPADPQTPRKSAQKSSSPAAAARRLPDIPQTPPLRTPERRPKPPAARTPARQALFRSFQDSSAHGCDLPSPKPPARKGRPLLERGASPLGRIPKTPTRPHGQPLGFLQDPAWSPAVSSSPGSPSGLAAAAVLSTGQGRPGGPTFSRVSLRSPPGEAVTGVQRGTALVGTPPNRKRQNPCTLRASQGKEPAQRRQVKAGRTPASPRDMPVTPSPQASPEEPLPSPVCDASRSPLGTPPAESPPPAQLDWKALWDPGSEALPLSHPTPSTAPKTSWSADPDVTPGRPPSHIRTKDSRTSDPEGSFPEGEPSTSAPAAGATDSPAAFTDTKKHPQDTDPSSPRPPPKHCDPALGFSRDWHCSSPWLIAGDTEHLSLLDGAEGHGARGQSSSASPAGEGAGLRTAVAVEGPSLSPLRDPPSPRSGPSSPPTPPCALLCPDHRGPQWAATPTQLSGAPTEVQTYEVELEMQASGVPKVRVKKRDASPQSVVEPPRRAQSVPPGLGMPRGSKPCKPETTYMSPPCLRPSHSSPSNSGGQTYICQSCTPSTPSPFQTDVGVPWTPSPKHSGRTTPDRIKDWPRRKRAVLCSLGAAAGRGDAGTGLPAGGSLLRLEGKELGLQLSISRSPLLGDFELEGVCQLPDQSPPGDSESKAEEAFSWGQFGLGSRKRLLSAEEEAECDGKRVCDRLRRDWEVGQSEERSPGMGVQQLPAMGVEEAPVSGSPSPPGCAPRSSLSATGLQALTQSPLLFPGKMDSSQHRDAPDEDTDLFPPKAEDSPFSRAFSRRRPISRTYSRKKLIS
ncbi:treslin [Sturnira hondurensis]|uniref:treslin n=1 Tax=Sturnira hondurensis TaxID=192404 RepID=UPI00187A3AB2|nr:treslin [Sturnira hondurensis]